MKKLLVLIVASSSFMIVSCGENEEKKELSEVEKLAETYCNCTEEDTFNDFEDCLEDVRKQHEESLNKIREDEETLKELQELIEPCEERLHKLREEESEEEEL